MIKRLDYHLTAKAPLLMHNGRLAIQSDPYARAMKEITSKRSKTDADYVELSRLEFLGGLYLNGDDEPCIPGYVFEASLIGKGGAARKERKGKEAAAALWVVEDFPLKYDGPRDPNELWEAITPKGKKTFVHQAIVRVKGSAVNRTRATFRDWSVKVWFEFDTELLDEDQVKRWVRVAGDQVGLMDWRPKFGRFNTELLTNEQ